MPGQRRRQQPVKRTKARVQSRRRRTTTKSSVSIVIKTITLKTRHNKEEIYPIPLKDIISRANVGDDADIFAHGYTLSVSVATGNDISTVTSNVGHSGPWVRRGQSSNDTFNQQHREHDFKRSKTVIFRRNLSASERQFINPDTPDNYLNLRIRDPCGVIPGATIKLECRFRLSRPTPSTTFVDGGSPATDLYEDQDVSGSSGGPQPPSAVQDVPAKITYESFGHLLDYTPQGTTSPLRYTRLANSKVYTVTVAGKINIVGEFNDIGGSVQAAYTKDGYEGNIVSSG